MFQDAHQSLTRIRERGESGVSVLSCLELASTRVLAGGPVGQLEVGARVMAEVGARLGHRPAGAEEPRFMGSTCAGATCSRAHDDYPCLKS